MNHGYQQNYGPPQGQYNGPPPPNQGWQNQGGYPPQQGYGQQYPANNQYYQGHPQAPMPPPQQGGFPPPPNQYNAPYGAPPMQAPPSLGYIPGQQANHDLSRAADDARGAMKGFGTDERALIRALATLGPLEVSSIKVAFQARHRRDIMKDVHGETSGYFRDGLESILRGPLENDCYNLYDSTKGVGTKESAMNDVLLGRSNADLQAIKTHYHRMFHRTVEADVKGDLSMKTERLFDMVMAARRNEESTPVIPPQIDADVQEIYHATEGRPGTDQLTVCSILTSRSDGQIRAISQAYRVKYHRGLDETIKKEFSGHMETALLFIVRHAEDPAKHDADMLEDAMKGMGTKDTALIRRVIAIHWDPQRLQQCKAAYKHFYKRELADRIRSETSGDYRNLMLACIGDGMPYGR